MSLLRDVRTRLRTGETGPCSQLSPLSPSLSLMYSLTIFFLPNNTPPPTAVFYFSVCTLNGSIFVISVEAYNEGIRDCFSGLPFPPHMHPSSLEQSHTVPCLQHLSMERLVHTRDAGCPGPTCDVVSNSCMCSHWSLGCT